MLTRSLRFGTLLANQRSARARASEPPLRAELFGVEQLARHAAALAARHQIVTERGSNRLLARLDHNEEVLRAFNRATLEVDKSRRVTPAAEWLLDNFYLIEEQIQMARRHLPREYSRELPRLTNGPSAGLLRVYDIVLELVSHVDAEIDATSLTAFVAAYQTVSALKLGELWAIPIMLRLGLIENLQRVTTGLTSARHDRDLANVWVDRLQDMAEKNPSRLVIVVADMAQADLPLVQFVCRGILPASLAFKPRPASRAWTGSSNGYSSRDFPLSSSCIRKARVRHRTRFPSVTASRASRSLGAIDWKEFLETLSLVEQTLRSEPADVYSDMDFATRDRYRHVVESLARQSRLSETEVAQMAVQLANESAGQRGREDRTAHVGYYLIDKGRPVLERAAKVRQPWKTFVERSLRRFPFTFYVGGICLLTLVATFAFMREAQALGVHGGRLIFCTLTFLLGVSQLGVALFNWLATLLVSPRLLPRLDYSSGIPPDRRTMVVVPTILSGLESLDSLLETLEIHHLANRDEHLHFALLTDLPDASEENLPEDKPLIESARTGVERLNRRYAAGREPLFFLFHRPRLWNAGEGVWMGYERKRGKLMEFNALLRGRSRECSRRLSERPRFFPRSST